MNQFLNEDRKLSLKKRGRMTVVGKKNQCGTKCKPKKQNSLITSEFNLIFFDLFYWSLKCLGSRFKLNPKMKSLDNISTIQALSPSRKEDLKFEIQHFEFHQSLLMMYQPVSYGCVLLIHRLQFVCSTQHSVLNCCRKRTLWPRSEVSKPFL